MFEFKSLEVRDMCYGVLGDKIMKENLCGTNSIEIAKLAFKYKIDEYWTPFLLKHCDTYIYIYLDAFSLIVECICKLKYI